MFVEPRQNGLRSYGHRDHSRDNDLGLLIKTKKLTQIRRRKDDCACCWTGRRFKLRSQYAVEFIADDEAGVSRPGEHPASASAPGGKHDRRRAARG